jgi:hypothetical protein
MTTHESSSYQVFHSFTRRYKVFSISVTTKNLLLSVAESITQTLNITSCYACGGMNMGDCCPWEAKELNPQEPFNETTLPNHRRERLAPKNFYYWE